MSIDVHSPCNGIHLLSNKRPAKYLYYVIHTLLFVHYYNQRTILIQHTHEPLSKSTGGGQVCHPDGMKLHSYS
jgi:hypothetical protein